MTVALPDRAPLATGVASGCRAMPTQAVHVGVDECCGHSVL